MEHFDTTIENGKALKKAYLKAKRNNKETFMFQNVELVTNYAKYLLEYLETSVFKQKL